MLNRRHLFAATAAVAVVAAPAIAVASQADAALIEMGQRYQGVWSAHVEAEKAVKNAYEAYKSALPAPPASLVVTNADIWDFGGGLPRNRGKPLSSRSYDHLAQWVESRATMNDACWKRCSPRALALIAAYDEYEALELRTSIQTGLRAAGDRADHLYDELSELQQAIVDAPFSTMAGLRVKALVASHLIPGADDTNNDWHDTVALKVIDALLKGGLN